MYHRRSIGLVVLSLFLAALFASPLPASAQGANVCTTTKQEALIQTAVNCADMGTNAACYGFDAIESVLSTATNGDAFSEPGDTVGISDVVTLRPGAIDTVDETWGVTVVNLQANLPSGLPDNVVVVGLGGAEIEAGVPEYEAFVPTDSPVSLATSAAGELRQATLTAPRLAKLIAQVPSGSVVSADAVSEDGEWVRVILDDQPGWLSASALAGADLSALPVLNDGQLTAMQSFYLRTGIDNGACAPGSSWVIVQGPKETPVDLVLNNLHIRIESTIALRTLTAGEPVGQRLQILVLYGLARLNPDTPDEIIVPAGYTTMANYGPDFISAGIEGDADERSGPESIDEPRLVTQQELDDVGVISLLPPVLLNYPATPPIIVTPSGVGGPIVELIFEDPVAIVGVEQLCQQGLIPVAICQVFGFGTP